MSTVEVTSPPRMTTAIGCSISWPGMLPMLTSGTSARPVGDRREESRPFPVPTREQPRSAQGARRPADEPVLRQLPVEVRLSLHQPVPRSRLEPSNGASLFSSFTSVRQRIRALGARRLLETAEDRARRSPSRQGSSSPKVDRWLDTLARNRRRPPRSFRARGVPCAYASAASRRGLSLRKLHRRLCRRPPPHGRPSAGGPSATRPWRSTSPGIEPMSISRPYRAMTSPSACSSGAGRTGGSNGWISSK